MLDQLKLYEHPLVEFSARAKGDGVEVILREQAERNEQGRDKQAEQAGQGNKEKGNDARTSWAERFPPGDPRRDVPALPTNPEARWRWLVGELDAARGQTGGVPHRSDHPDDVADPHEHGAGTHAVADAQLRESTDALVRLLRVVALPN